MTTPGWPPAAQPVSWTNDDLTKDQHPSAHNQVAGLVNLIVAVLGNDPAGGSANATARFAAIEAAVTAAQGDIGVWLAKNTLRTGSDVPPPELGIDGDAYFRDVTKTLYVKAAGGWGSPLSLVGDKGDKGDKGDTGDVGPASTVPGPKGDKGNKGDTGDPGPAGGDITNADELPFDPGASGLTSSDAGAALRELAEGVASAELVEVHTSAHGAITLDVNAAAVHVLKLSGSAVLTFTGAPELPKAGALTVVVEQPVTPALLTWPSSVRWSDNVVPNVLSGERTAVFTFLSYDGGATWLGALGIQRATNPTGGL